jgi:hypothetical protein
MKRFTCFVVGPLPSNRFVTADGIGKIDLTHNILAMGLDWNHLESR